jgi:AcrR family transcriptional regulator
MAQAPEAPPRKPGRPRSAAAGKAIVAAAAKLLAQTGVRDLSIEAVARAAGVGKATIYRHYPTGKAGIVLDVLLTAPELRAPVADARNYTDAMDAQLCKLLSLLSFKHALTLGQILAEGAGDPAARYALESRFMGPLRAGLRASIVAGQKAGEFGPGLDPDVAVDALCGAPFFRLLSTGRALDTPFCDAWRRAAIELLKNGTPRAAGRLL